MPEFFDIACNFSHKSFLHRLDEVIASAKSCGVKKFAVISANIDDIDIVRDLKLQYEEICASTAGVHPHHASELMSWTHQDLKEIISKASPNAIGETGLDYYRNLSTKEEQINAFKMQVQIAIELNLPLFLHQRDSHEDFYKILMDYKNDLPSFVVHCFTAGPKELNDYLNLGAYIGLTGWICDAKRNQELRESIKEIPIERLLIETDCPYLIPKNIHPKPNKNINEPKYLPHIAKEISSLRNESYDEIAVSSLNNAELFFSKTT